MSCTSSASEQLWALVDCSCFYCSCERLFRPDLAKKPVVVLSNNDGCLIALTPEAKALGFTMGQVYFEIAHQLQKQNVAVFSSNYTLYGDISRRVMGVMGTVVDTIHQYSIDEAFVPLTGAMVRAPEKIGWEIYHRIGRWVGMPVRVGIGPTRTLAKLANLWAKKMSRVFMVRAETSELDELLAQTPVSNIWGIGRQLSKKLALLGIMNALQLKNMDLEKALRVLTVTGQRVVYELRGHPCVTENTVPVARKTLISSCSFGRTVTRQEDITEALVMHASIAGERLRHEKMLAGAIRVWCETSRHGEEPYHTIGGGGRLSFPTNNTVDIAKGARLALERCYQKGFGFMKGGIMLYDLVEENRRQLSLFEAMASDSKEKQRKTMQALDAINKRYGRDTLRLASQGEKGAPWRMRRERMSPYYTTKFSDLPVVSCEGKLQPQNNKRGFRYSS